MYRLNDAQQRIADTAAAIADKDLAPRAAASDRDAAFPKDSLAALGAAGLLGLNVPQAHGGLGEGMRTAAAVIDALAQRCPSTAMVYLMHLCGVACYAAAPDKTAALLRQAAGLDKGSVAPGRVQAGTITQAQVTEIAQTKMPDLNALDLEAAKLQVVGTARSMGIKVDE